MKEQFLMQGRYQRLMNQHFYEACTQLKTDDLLADRSAFFKSIIGTLNHMLLTDRIWLASFQGQKEEYDSLDQILYADFAELRLAREATDQAISEWLDGVSEEELAAGFHDRLKFPLWVAVTHFFNHQTHHRGQVSQMLSEAGVDYGATDMPFLPGVVDWSASA